MWSLPGVLCMIQTPGLPGPITSWRDYCFIELGFLCATRLPHLSCWPLSHFTVSPHSALWTFLKTCCTPIIPCAAFPQSLSIWVVCISSLKIRDLQPYWLLQVTRLRAPHWSFWESLGNCLQCFVDEAGISLNWYICCLSVRGPKLVF